MSNRYKREVEERAMVLACNASSVRELCDRVEHPPGQCLDCDAYRILESFVVDLNMNLHKIRRQMSGYGLKPDPLDE